MEQYCKDFEEKLEHAKDYKELLTLVALPLIKQMLASGKELHITLGCIMNGGVATKMGTIIDDPAEFYDINAEVFTINQERISSALNENIVLFDQMAFEDVLRKINPTNDNLDSLINEFYSPLFEVAKLKKVYLQPYWYESGRKRKEITKLKDLNVEFYELPEGSHDLDKEEYKTMLAKLKPVSKEYLEDTITAPIAA